MVQAFLSTLEEASFDQNHHFLLAVSGGVDSMVLWDLFHRSEMKYALAHVNFQLRGEASDQDETFVMEQAQEIGATLFTTQFDTEVYAKEKKLSIQMAARELRYQWFAELMQEHGFTTLVTAHHLNDSIETLLINLNRGTGLRGLSGIQSTKALFRPLHEFSKKEIEKYASTFNIRYREDESNSSLKYERNWFRHYLIAPWEEHNVQFTANMRQTFKRLRESQQMLEEYLSKSLESLRTQLKDGYLEIAEIRELDYPDTMLHELLHEYGFTESQLTNLQDAIDLQAVGKQFFSQTHYLTIDREKVFLSGIKDKREECYELIEEGIQRLGLMQFSATKKKMEQHEISKDRWVEAFDYDKLHFPLQLRRWKEGDWFMPLGMQGKKKVSDLLIDRKVSRHFKEDCWVLLSDEQVIWVIGLQIDERYKLGQSTKTVYELSVKHE